MKVLFEKIYLPSPDSEREICQLDGFADYLPSVSGRVYPLSDEEIAKQAGVPDPRCHRQVGRAGILALLHYQELKKILAEERPDPQRVGLYFAGAPGVIDWKTCSAIAKGGGQEITDILRGSLPPKQMLKYGTNTACAQLGIFLGLRGPMYSYLDWRSSGPAQFDQANHDLISGVVDLAILIASSSLEDPLLNFVYHKLIKTQLSEASVCLLLRDNGESQKRPRLVDDLRLALKERPYYFYVDSFLETLGALKW